MDIAVTGSHGFIGATLVKELQAAGHRVVPVVRRGGGDGTIAWDPSSGSIDAAGLEGLDAVVHLAGEGIASRPWTSAQRSRIMDSRRDGTTLLARTLATLDRPPASLVSGSAIGFYGDRGDEVLSEGSTRGDGFLAEVCQVWEDATEPAARAGIRVARIRTSVVLDATGGALGVQLRLFRMGLGGRAGRGRQWMSWISLADEVAAIMHILENPSIEGPVNLSAPAPVTNAHFTEVLGDLLGRPTFLTVPSAVRHAPFGLGDLVDSLLFTSARVHPDALVASGFEFSHPSLEAALAATV